MDHVGVLLVGLDGFELLVQFDGDLPIRCDAKSTFKKHLAVLGNNTCMHIVQVRSISHRFPSNRCCLACALTEKGRTLFEKRLSVSSTSTLTMLCSHTYVSSRSLGLNFNLWNIDLHSHISDKLHWSC